MSRGSRPRTERRACGAGMEASVWRDAKVGRGLVGCSWVYGGCRGPAEQLGGTGGGGGHECFALSVVTE